jgi:hypothetical protein
MKKMLNNPASHDITKLRFIVLNSAPINNDMKEVVLSQVIGPSGDSYTLAQRINVDGHPVYLKGTFHVNLTDLKTIRDLIDHSLKEFEKSLK